MTSTTFAAKLLFSRQEDTQFSSFDDLYTHCLNKQRNSETSWRLPVEAMPICYQNRLQLKLAGSRAFELCDWSFGQICRLAGLKKESLNRLTPATAAQVLEETIPRGQRPLQVYSDNQTVRSIHRVGYTRIHDAELLEVIIDVAFDLDPPPIDDNGSIGLYAGEQDMFAFMIDRSSWVEVGEEQFAPGFYVWNSEVGRRSMGVATFWFQRGCGNHILWDASSPVSFTRSHTASVSSVLTEFKNVVRLLAENCPARKDAFARSMAKAQQTSLGSQPDDVIRSLSGLGISPSLVQQAVTAMAEQGVGFTLYRTVDFLTRIAGKLRNAGDRLELDSKIGQLLALAN